MASFGEPPNPLRPYYIPPTIGPPPEIASNATSSAAKSGRVNQGFSFPDIDYSIGIDIDTSPSAFQSLKDFVDKAIWNYSSALIAQPFEVAKTIIQVYVPPEDDGEGNFVPESRRTASFQSSGSYRGAADEDSSDEEPNYFTSSAPYTTSTSPPRGRPGRPSRRITDREGYIQPSSTAPHTFLLKNPRSLMDALSSLTSASGVFAMWKGTNVTFLYTILSGTTETFLRSLIAAILGLPDADLPSVSGPGGGAASDILITAFPLATFLVTTAASALSALILSPIDTARTRLILTPSTHGPRSLTGTLRTLPTPYLIPAHLIPITFFHSSIPSALSTSAPLFFKSYLSLDPVMTPTSWSMAMFITSSAELIFRFPLETILRRAQISTFTSPALRARAQRSKTAYTSTTPPPKCQTIVPVQQTYRGIFQTAWSIVHEEGYSIQPTSSSPAAAAAAALGKDVDGKTRRRKGQGIEGLYRGWRLGMWSLIGVWGAGWMGGMAAGAGSEASQSAPRKF